LPFFFRAATFDDEVIVRDVGDDLVEVVRISRSSGNSLVRVVHDTLEKRQDLLSFLEEAGFLFEGLSQHSLIAINIEDKAGYQRLNTWLEEFVADGLADYEEPLLRF
jgi:hypothetical protein